jgi:hypothetical protein
VTLRLIPGGAALEANLLSGDTDVVYGTGFDQDTDLEKPYAMRASCSHAWRSFVRASIVARARAIAAKRTSHPHTSPVSAPRLPDADQGRRTIHGRR